MLCILSHYIHLCHRVSDHKNSKDISHTRKITLNRTHKYCTKGQIIKNIVGLNSSWVGYSLTSATIVSQSYWNIYFIIIQIALYFRAIYRYTNIKGRPALKKWNNQKYLSSNMIKEPFESLIHKLKFKKWSHHRFWM